MKPSGSAAPPFLGRFLTPIPRLIHIKRDFVITVDDLRWLDPDGTERILRRGFPSDGASVPWIATLRWSPWDERVLGEALLHDGGYSLRETEFALGNKAEVDLRFYRGMIVAGFPRERLFWRAVQAGGWLAWWSPNNPLVDGYLYAIRNRVEDEWIESFRRIPGEDAAK